MSLDLHLSYKRHWSVATMKAFQSCDLATDPWPVLLCATYKRSMNTGCGLFHLVYPWTYDKGQCLRGVQHTVATAPSRLDMCNLFPAISGVILDQILYTVMFLITVITPLRLFWGRLQRICLVQAHALELSAPHMRWTLFSVCRCETVVQLPCTDRNHPVAMVSCSYYSYKMF